MTYATDRKTVAQLQADFLARGGSVAKLPTHAPATGSIRYNFKKQVYGQTHDYVIWAVSADHQQFSARVEKVKDIDAAEQAFMAQFEDASIQQIHEVR